MRGDAANPPLPVTIDHLEIRVLRLPLVRFFETSFGRSYHRTFVLVTVHGGGLAGWGESVADDNPYYSSETTETVWHVLTGFLAPLVMGRPFAHPREVTAALARVRGHNMAKAVLEMAAWDLYARQEDVPLWQVLGGTDRRIASGVSIGIQDSLEELEERVAVEREAGYQRIKIKIKPGWDVAAVERLRHRFGDIPLMVDANAAYTLDDATHLASLDGYDLIMIEQPLDYDDVMDHAALQRRIATPICLDESITTPRLARMAIEAGACRVINIKPGRLGGHGESVRVARPRRPLTGFRSGTEACSSRASDAPTTCTCPRSRTSSCPATSPPAGGTSTRTSSSRPSRSAPTGPWPSRPRVPASASASSPTASSAPRCGARRSTKS